MLGRIVVTLFVVPIAFAAEYVVEEDVAYREGEVTEYMAERCTLDVYYPKGNEGFATVVWFHGGGLAAGKKFVPDQLEKKGIAVVAVNYRLTPKVKVADCIDDAAAAVAWTFNNIEKYGGARDNIIVSGHSAGGYLTMMIGLDKQWLAKYEIDANDIAGLAPYSGHTITHFAARKERGIKDTQAVVDELAPLFHVRKDAPPMLLVTGDRDLEMLGRYEENAYFWRMMQVVGHPDTRLHELDAYNHGQMAGPAHPILIRFIREVL